MDVKILGPSCANCLKLELMVMDVLQELGVEATVEKVADPKAIQRWMEGEPPGLVINGTLASNGVVPPVETLRRWLAEAA